METILNKRGKFGRILGVLHVDATGEKTSINDMLVEEGHAKQYFGGTKAS